MNDQQIVAELQEIGLSEKEARVYLAVLELGQETVQHIAEKADVNRATTYVILESLATKGLVTTIGDDKKAVYVAEGPHALNNIIHEQEEELLKKGDELEHIMPELNTLYNLHPEKPVVRFYEGKEGLKEMQKAFLTSGVKKAEMFFSQTDVTKIFSQEEREEIIRLRSQKQIYAVVIENDQDASRELQKHRKKEASFESLIVPYLEYPLTSDVTVYGDKVMIASLKGHVSGVIIESSEIADTVREIFYLAYSQI